MSVAEAAVATTAPKPVPAAGANTTLSQSVELMTNYKQVEIMAPQAALFALQTQDGLALLFSVGTDGIAYVTRETPGAAAGASRTDLSSALATGHAGATAKTVAVAQNLQTGTIDVALVMTADGTDTLHLSLGNSASDLSWIATPHFAAVPYDDTAHPLPKLVIADVFINQGSSGEAIAVDALRDPDHPAPVVFRYFIDPTMTLTGQAWNPHDVAADLDAGKVQSRLGRRKGDFVDGLYTLGQIGGHNVLLFQPLYDAFNAKLPANPVRLSLPASVIGSALATARTDGDSTTLFVAAGSTLYAFAPDGQADGDSGNPLVTDSLLQDAQALFADSDGSDVVVWGLDRADQVFFTACPKDKLHDPASWSPPIPITTGVEQLAPFVNCKTDAHTFFAHVGEGRLRKAVRSPLTTTWTFQDILLPAPLSAKSTKLPSYTTRLQLKGSDGNPLVGTLDVSTTERIGVYVNGLFTLLDVAPIPVATDATGGVVFVEWVDGLGGHPITATATTGGSATTAPMEKPFRKASALDSKDKLRAATIDTGDGPGPALVPASVSDADLDAASQALGHLDRAYTSLQSGPPKALLAAAPRAIPAHQVVTVRRGAAPASMLLSAGPLQDFGDAIETAAGDLLSWLEGAADFVVHIVEDAASGVWHFVAEIAGKAYRFLLDAAEKVVGALEVVFHAIETAIEDLIQFLEFLFEWKDFVRAKDLVKQIVLLTADSYISEIETLKETFNGLITQAKDAVDDWAGITHDAWQPGAPHGSSGLGFASTLEDIEEALTAPAMFLVHHLGEHAQNASGSGGHANLVDEILDRALQAIDDEGDIVLDAIERIRTQLLDGSAFQSLSLDAILKKLAAIVVDALLNTAENAVDTVLDVLTALLRAAVDALDTPVRIPVVSDILEDVFHVSGSFSMLDAIALACAIPAVIVYKVAEGSSPFDNDGGFTQKVIDAPNTQALAQAFAPAAPPAGGAPVPTMMMMAAAPGADVPAHPVAAAAGYPLPIALSGDAQRMSFALTRIVGGIASLIGGIFVVVDAATADTDAAVPPTFEVGVGIAKALATLNAGMLTLFKPALPIEQPNMRDMARACAGLSFVGRIVFYVAPSAVVSARGLQGHEATQFAGKIRKVGAAYDGIFAILGLVPTCYSFYELGKEPVSAWRSAAITDQTANTTSALARCTGASAALFAKDPETKAILITILGVLIVIRGGLQIADGIVAAGAGDPPS